MTKTVHKTARWCGGVGCNSPEEFGGGACVRCLGVQGLEGCGDAVLQYCFYRDTAWGVLLELMLFR